MINYGDLECSAFMIARQEREADAALEAAADQYEYDKMMEAGGPFPIFDDPDAPDMWDEQDRQEYE